jgi:hypothetical protein
MKVMITVYLVGVFVLHTNVIDFRDIRYEPQNLPLGITHQKHKIFLFSVASVSRPAVGPTQPPVQWVPGVLSPGVKRGRGVMLTTPI